MDINGIFNPENRFFKFMEKIMNLCLLGMLWALFSFPVITVGASAAALFKYTLRLTKDEEGYVWDSYWKGFKEDFLPATLLWIAAAAMGIFLAVDFYGCQFLPFPETGKWILRVLLTSLIFLYLLTLIYVFPLMAFFRFSVKKTITNAFVMAVGKLHISITILVIYLLFGVLTWMFWELFMVWSAFACWIASYFYRWVFEWYMERNTEEM